MKLIVRWIPFLLVLGAMGGALAVAVVPVSGQTTDGASVYLPFAAHHRTYSPSLSIVGESDYGYENPTVLTLDFFDGVTTRPVATTTVIRPWHYYFLNQPLLKPGQFYRVSYYNGQYGNSDHPGRLNLWHSFPITETNEGVVQGGKFSVADVPILFPSNQRQVQVPFIFEWRDRTYYEVWPDRFVLSFYDMNETLLYSTPNLGRIFQHEFDPLSVGLALNTPYLWDVRLSQPNGAFGIGYEPKREVTFIEQEAIGVPTGLVSVCVGTSSNYNLCRFRWNPVEGATGYYIHAHYPGGWTEISSSETLIFCGNGGTQQWRVKARSDTGEGAFATGTYTFIDCIPQCGTCTREMLNEQRELQSNGL